MKKILGKGQMITFDLGISITVFLIFIAIVIGFFFIFQRYENEQAFEFELEYIFYNFENNLKADGKEGVFSDYRVDKNELDSFAASITDIDSYILGYVSNAHGIGMSEEGYDSCLFFTDTDGSVMDMGGKMAIGLLKSSTCNQEITAQRNPCEGYRQALSLFKPVLYDEGDPSSNRIVLMNIVICKK